MAMLIPEIAKNLINKIQFDQFGRINAVLAIDKPIGMGSHEVVDKVRRILRTRHVGHAGALDPFASGMLLILVGKYTKYTDAFIAMDKSYLADVLLGLKTTTQDPEGDVLQQQSIKLADLPEIPELEAKLTSAFCPGYLQFVPLFSSVKISGQKLRVLARKAKAIKFIVPGEVELEMPGSGTATELITVKLPAKRVELTELKITQIQPTSTANAAQQELTGKFLTLQLKISCSKGTYIRQLAEDIGNLLELPASLSQLRRTRVGEFSESFLCQLSDIEEQAKALNILPTPERR